METKTCNVCQQEQPITNFYANRKKRLGVESACKKCFKTRGERWRLKRVFGMTEEDFEQRLREQGGCCKICGKTSETEKRKQRFSVDHYHATKVVRGLLCDQCNKGLGCFRDSPGLVEAAAAYLVANR
jgi:hypothetical protein